MIKILQSWQEIQESRGVLKQRGLDFTEASKTRFWRFLFDLRFRYKLFPPQPDIIKSWDVARATQLIETNIMDKQAPILDMGCYNSEILYVLNALGYKSLHGCDLNPICRWMPFRNKIRYQVADLTQTPYPDNYFSAITCLSVVEHGVSIENLIREVKRIISPRGLFILTTDYDATEEKHNISPDFKAFGQSWTIFNPSTLNQLIKEFCKEGFELLKPDEICTTNQECPIFWQGEKYTFIMVALKGP